VKLPGVTLTKQQILSLAESVQEDFKGYDSQATFRIEPTNLHEGKTIVFTHAVASRPSRHDKVIFISRRGHRQEMEG
jgi:hypothetical protein